jgi:imidazolonepropionase-like amidohydrolase
MKENAKVSHNPDEGIQFACGSDIGTFPHGENARELRLMHSLGMPEHRVLQSATLGGWRCVRGMEWEGKEGEERLVAQMHNPVAMGDNEVPFGRLERGFAADIIASSGRFPAGENFDKAVSAESIVFVMKAGKVYKEGGRPVV